MKRVVAYAAAFIPLLAPCAAEPLSDSEIWNSGVDSYLAGDTTNAMSALRPLMLSRTHGTRAAEVVSKLAHDAGDLEESAAAAAIALRANPDDERVNRNFTRAIDGVPELRRRKRVEKALAAAKGRDCGEMLLESTRRARSLMRDAVALSELPPANAVAEGDRLSAAADALSLVWPAAGEAISQAVTNEEQAATILAQIAKAEESTIRAAELFSDLDGGAYSAVAEAEMDFNRFAKLVAMPPAAIGEDLVCQSNAYMNVEEVNGRKWQGEALDFTRAFRDKFPAWARAYEAQAQSDTNKPPFTAEAQAEISALSTELEKIQLECCETPLPPEMEKALAIIERIRELLPKDGGGGQNGQPPPQQQNKNDDDQKNDKKDNGGNESNGGENQEPPQEDQGKDEGEEQNGEEGESPDDREVEALLMKAQERNDEHEAEKQRRMRKAPLPPNERDW